MVIDLVNPPGVPTPPDVYNQVAIATGSRQVFLAGQVALDAAGNLVGKGDFAAQVEQCYVNVATAVTGVGGTLADLAKLTFYVVDYTPDMLPLLVEGVARAFARLGVDPVAPPATLLGVAALSDPDHLVEVEAVAVLD
jgi:enamine deaminase RidA (YjgF/YER057c/UK114 family)